MPVRLLYFAWLREKIGRADEILDLPPTLATVADLLVWLKQRGPEYEAAFARPDVIRAALDKRHAQPGAALAGAREIALFPPVTGG
jgi:molybdopterin synthase sulfur carrier subunit